MFKAGQYLQICDVCGFKFHSDETRKRWDGLIVCFDDYEVDHPQKYIRVSPDGGPVPDPRPEPADLFRLVCTIWTHTPAADIGTADCAMVDSVPNLNAVEYGYPPLVLPPVAPIAPTPLLLDTFTAANGTDPTSRDLDVYLPSQARWQIVPTDPPIIESNGLMGVDNGSGRDTGSLGYILPDTSQIFDGGTPYTVLLCVTTSDAVFLEFYADDFAGSGKVNLYWDGATLTFDARDDAMVDFSLSHAYAPSGGAEKFAFWTDGVTGHVIVNGASVVSGSYGLGATNLNGIFPYLGSAGLGVTARIDSIGVYQNITLEQAIALTSSVSSPPTTLIYESGIYEPGIYE